MNIVEIDTLDGKGLISVAVHDLIQKRRLLSYTYEATAALENQEKLAAVVKWLEVHQPDVFSRGLWEAAK